MRQAAMGWGGFSPSLLRALVVQRIDAWIGLPLLTAGFGFQLANVLGFSLEETDVRIAWVLAIAWMLGCIVARRHLAAVQLAVLLGQIRKEEKP